MGDETSKPGAHINATATAGYGKPGSSKVNAQKAKAAKGNTAASNSTQPSTSDIAPDPNGPLGDPSSAGGPPSTSPSSRDPNAMSAGIVRRQTTPSPTKQCMSYDSLAVDISNKMKALCNDSSNASLSDVSFAIGRRRQEFHCVAALFAIHSPVLAAQIRESKRTGQVITFVDVTPACFGFVREYFYSLNPVLSLRNIADVLYIADKLQVAHLEAAARQFLDEIAGVNDLVLVLSQLFARKLLTECDRVISSRKLFEDASAIEVLRSENLKTLPCELMMRLLRYDHIRMSEEGIFERTVTWAKWHEKVNVSKQSENGDISMVTTEEVEMAGWQEVEQTEWQQIIQPLLPYIRFPIMKGEYFTAHVVDMKILSTDDCTLIMQYLFTQKENEDLKYSTKKRFDETKATGAAAAVKK